MSSAWTKPGPLGITWRSVVLHVATWAIFVALAALTAVGDDSEVDTAKDPPDLSILLQVPVAIYAAFLLYHFTARRGRHVAFLLGLALISTAYPYVASSLYEDPIFMQDDNYLQGAVNVLIIILLALGVRAGYNLVERTAELRTLRAERAEAQLSALRAQINPHFLFNTLNNIYGVNIDDPERGSAMLLELAEVMRYHYDLSSRREVALSNEVDLIRSVVQLERLRLRENTTVTLDLPDQAELRGLRVPPLLLVPFVENAFKHGTHPSHAGEVHVRLTVSPDHLDFETRNPVYADRQTVSTGVGVDNVRKRLELTSKHDYELETGQHEGKWHVRLRLPIARESE